jgi:hypothetical protein
MTLAPILNYNTVVLDQEAGTFTIVEPEEVQGCLYDHCVTSNPETNIVTTSCGIPQYFDRQLELCKFEEVISNGIFLKRLGADGIVFNVREEVTAQIFCATQVHSKAHKISRSGVVNLPAGCTFSITTNEGKKLSIKALPVAQIIEFQQLDIIIGGPEQIFKDAGTEATSNGTSGLRRIINDHLSYLSDQLNGNSELINSHKTYVIIMAVILSLLAIVTVIIGFLFYRYSTRFRTKVRAVRSELQEGLKLAMKGNKSKVDRNQMSHLLPGFDEPPPVPPREKEYLDLLLKKLEILEDKVLRSETYLQMTGSANEQIYQNMSEPLYCPTPKPKPKLYPLVPSKEEIEQTKSLLSKTDSKFNPSAPS